MIRSEMISPTDLDASLHSRALSLERFPSSFVAICSIGRGHHLYSLCWFSTFQTDATKQNSSHLHKVLDDALGEALLPQQLDDRGEPVDLLADLRRAGQAVRVRVVVLVVAVVVVALRYHAADLSLVDYVVRESCKIRPR